MEIDNKNNSELSHLNHASMYDRFKSRITATPMTTNNDVQVRLIFSDKPDEVSSVSFSHKMFVPAIGDSVDIRTSKQYGDQRDYRTFTVINTIRHFQEDHCDYTLFLGVTSDPESQEQPKVEVEVSGVDIGDIEAAATDNKDTGVQEHEEVIAKEDKLKDVETSTPSPQTIDVVLVDE